MSPRETAAEARARVEADRDQVRAEREARFAEAYGERVPGRWIVVVSWVSTVVLAVATLLAAVRPEPFVVGCFVVSLAWFALGCVVFVVVLVVAAGRSREVDIGIGGLFLLIGTAPAPIRRSLLASLAVQVVVAVAGAAVRPFTPLAFATLAPILPLALCGLWVARHGVFPPRRDGGGR